MRIHRLFYFRTVQSNAKYYFLLHFIVLLYGFTGIVGKMVSIESYELVWWRILVSVIALAFFMRFTKRSFRVENKKELLTYGLVGCAVAIHWSTFYMAIELSTASLGIVCMSTSAIHVAWLDPLINKTKISWFDFFLSSAVIIGIVLIANDFNSGDYIALIYGLVSAFFASLFSVYNGRLVKEHPPSKISFYELLTGILFMTVLLLSQGKFNADLFAISIVDFLWILFLGVLCTTFAFIATIEVIKYLGTFTVSLSINLEPIYTIILAIVLLSEHEQVGPRFYIGTIIILVVVFANGIVKGQRRKKTQLSGQ